MPKLVDPIRIMAQKKAAARHRYIQRWSKDHGLNWWKVLCLRWQASTGNRCTKRGHTDPGGTWANKLECEAQLTECLMINFEFGSMTDQQWEEYKLRVEAWANA